MTGRATSYDQAGLSLTEAVRGLYLSQAISLVLRAFYDGSGKWDNPSDRMLTLCGYALHTEHWADFDWGWKKLLDKHRLAHIHMKYFNRKDGPFKHLTVTESRDGRRSGNL